MKPISGRKWIAVAALVMALAWFGWHLSQVGAGGAAACRVVTCGR